MNQLRPLSQVVFACVKIGYGLGERIKKLGFSSLRSSCALFAVMLVLALTLFPHHHHDGGAACWTEEVCPEDGRMNDRHTAHGTEEQDEHEACCVQAMPIAKIQVRAVDGNGADGNSVFTVPQILSSITPIIYSVSETKRFASSHRYRACPFGKHIQRRGPPVCQL